MTCDSCEDSAKLTMPVFVLIYDKIELDRCNGDKRLQSAQQL